jgi:biotin carboxyl carrier protein
VLRRLTLAALGLALAFGACTPAARTVETAAAAAPTTTTTSTTTTSTTVLPEPTTTTTAPPPPPRQVSEPAGAPFATTHGVTLVHPADVVERVAFHQSNHDGARELQVLDTAVNPFVLESRERDTPAATAADIVVAPDGAIRAPVTGTVKRAGGYTLYCKYRDDYLVIAPDAAPHLEVKLLHIDGVQVRAGQRVVAGETVVAPHATALPFASQVDEVATAAPAWPHVHVEVVDPSIKDRPTPGGGCT